MNNKNRFIWIFYFSLCASLLLEILVGPASGGTDVYIFKDAGCNLGLGYGFKSSFLPGYSDINPEIFSSYAPGLPYLFGLFTSLFGCSGFSNLIFNWLLASLVSVLLVSILPGDIKNKKKYIPVAFILGFSVWKGNFDGDRPEILSLILFLILCRCKMSEYNFLKIYIAPFVLGCIILEHPYAGIVTILLYILHTLFKVVNDDDKNLLDIKIYREICFSIMIFSIPILIVLSIYCYYSDINALTRFFKHASVYSSLILDQKSYFHRLKHGISSYGILAILTSISFLISMVLSITFLLYIKKIKIISNKYFYILLFTFVATYILPIVLYPAQGNYWVWSMFSMIIILLFISNIIYINSKELIYSIIYILIIIFLISAFPKLVIDYIGRYQTYNSYLKSEKQVDKFFEQNHELLIGNNYILAPESHYFIIKNKFNNVINPNYLLGTTAINSSKIKGFLMCRERRDNDINTIESRLKQNFKITDVATEKLRVSIFGYKMRKERSYLCNYFIDSEYK